MQLQLDADQFENLQPLLVREIIEQIRFKLFQAGIIGTELKELTGEIAFSVTSTLDDTAAIEFDGTEVKPYLTFLADEDQLVHCGENSYTHEFVAAVMEQVFSTKKDS